MSVSLTLIFDRYGFQGRPILAFERLRLNWQDYEAFDRLTAEAIPLVNGVAWYGDEGLELRTEDEHETPLTYVAAHTIERHLAAAHATEWDAAVLALLRALPPDTKVVLWWN